MDTETYKSDTAKINALTTFVISLIRAHYEPSTVVVDGREIDKFKYTTRQVSEYFEKIDNVQLYSYVRVLNGDDKNVWVPM